MKKALLWNQQQLIDCRLFQSAWRAEPSSKIERLWPKWQGRSTGCSFRDSDRLIGAILLRLYYTAVVAFGVGSERSYDRISLWDNPWRIFPSKELAIVVRWIPACRCGCVKGFPGGWFQHD
jgi:hypothetical protein